VHRLLLGLILVAGFALRVWNNDYGLPFVWGIDEGFHFTSRAVVMFRDGFDPGYYQNPAGYTYAVYGLLRVMYGPFAFLFDLPWGNVTQQFNKDPAEIWIAARTLAAVFGVAGVAATYFAARRIWDVRVGLVAAALLSFAFLPVAYSRVAVTDVGSLVGVALALWGAMRAYEDGRMRWYLFAGAAAGLAVGFKYTAGLALLPLGIAAALRLPRDGRDAAVGLAAATALAGVVFLALNPYLFGSLDQWWNDLRDQARVTADKEKPGQESGGFAYYLESLTWGLGWLASFAALAGAVVELRRDWRRGLMLVAVPVVLFVYLGVQSRYFGRWLLPAYPALAMLAAVALVRAAELVPRGPVARAAVLTALTGVVLAQPLTADVRTALVLGRSDTRELVRDWLVSRYPPELRVSIEPAVPGRYYRNNPDGRLPSWLHRCPRRGDWRGPGWSYPGPDGKRVCGRHRPGLFARAGGGIRASAYHLVLDPGVIDEYRESGYCLVVTFEVVRERALGSGDADVRAYYDRLERESDVLARFSPYDKGADPVPFSFDLSYNYYPPEYHRPGPAAAVHRLRNCRQAYGPPPIPIPKPREAPPETPEEETDSGGALAVLMSGSRPDGRVPGR
jgi:Dolichyl-phosphate-mannose-protein mannosyltransferase